MQQEGTFSSESRPEFGAEPGDGGAPGDDAAARAAALKDGIQRHDAELCALGFPIWIGGEPTFTDRRSQAAEWTVGADGPEKRERARLLAVALARETPGSVLLRSTGRQYAGEAAPRWSWGVLARRDGSPIWSGPQDPLVATEVGGGCSAPVLAERLAARMRADGVAATVEFGSAAAGEEAREAVVLRVDGSAGGDEGVRLSTVVEEGAAFVKCVLPATERAEQYLALLEWLGDAARAVGLRALVVAGHPPPFDRSLWHATITPDPAVIEVNMAPEESLGAFHRSWERIARLAGMLGLSPVRWRWDGTETDSGGGGQITIGGPAAGESPLFRNAGVLPGLIRIAQRHPSLSYSFAVDSVGGSSQSARADEAGDEIHGELALALERLGSAREVRPDWIGRVVKPLLCDATGNGHRAELNVEKLWNPDLGARGCLGVLEFRALRMAASPAKAAALGALLRSLVAAAATAGADGDLIDWGGELHDRFALPWMLERDLRSTLAWLELNGFPLADALRNELLDDSARRYGTFALDEEGSEVTLRRALEFWPLVGDAASQDRGAARLMDSSTQRLEVVLTAREREQLAGWTLSCDGWRLPLRRADAGDTVARLIGLRYRAFVPSPGLHAELAAQGAIPLLFANRRTGAATRITLHPWRVDGLPYESLPGDAREAEARRRERVTVERCSPPAEEALRDPDARAVRDWSVDLRWLAKANDR